jgi:hypothetical protein
MAPDAPWDMTPRQSVAQECAIGGLYAWDDSAQDAVLAALAD